MPDEHEERELPTIREIEREIWRIAKSNNGSFPTGCSKCPRTGEVLSRHDGQLLKGELPQ